MIDKGEKTCPLCAEEMDLTDQYLKPCKCGYQICLWCWHHITDMAEKEKKESLCPACRTKYDKEKIVASCERLTAQLNNDRKKSQKVKSKSSEGRKDLNGVRVIQRKLVYVLSWPLELADEDRLQRREFFGQYGKVVKVAMSRTQTGAVQQFPNSTSSVYITYSKEEEAIRCIQSVQGFILNGRNLKACFGTMKYCHAWLRNTPCTNSECLYLHEIGAQEDSFSKDENITVHMRRIVQEITGAMDYSVRCSGNMLPPPVDDYVDNESSSRKIPKCVLNTAHSVARSSPPDGSIDRSVTLPVGALWGMHSSSQSSVASAVATKSTRKPALEDNHTANGNDFKLQELLDGQNDFPELSLSNRTQISNSRALGFASVDNSRAVSVPSDCTNFPEHTSQSCESMVSNGNREIYTIIQSVCSDPVPVDADSVVNGYWGQTRSDSSTFDHAASKPSHIEVPRDTIQHCVEETREVQPLQESGRNNANEVVVSKEEVKTGTALMSPLLTDQFLEAEDDISLFNRQRLKDPEVLSRHPNMANKSGFLSTSNGMQPCSSQYKAGHDETRTVFVHSSSDSSGSNTAPISHGYTEMPFRDPSRLNGTLDRSVLFPDKARDTQPTDKCFADSQDNSTSEMDERIIANIMSLDLDGYLSSPQNFTENLEAGVIEERSLKPASSNIVMDNQSRFSFARQEVSKDQAFESYNAFNQISHGGDFFQNSSKRQSADMDMLGMNNGLSSSYLKGIDYVTEKASLPSLFKPTSIQRGPVPAPPGFSAPNQPPPPGFSTNRRVQQAFEDFSGNHRQSDSTLVGNPYQSLPIENTGGVRDVQFMDPAILAVGGPNFRSNYQGYTNMFGNEAKLQQMVTQSPLSPQQNCRFTDSLGMASKLLDQSQGSNILSRNLVPNGHWDGLSNEYQSRSRLQNERLMGSTNRIPGYNGTFRI